jgi:hypothetical protein
MSSAGPATLFKLIESRYGEALVKGGEIKISTLHTCRRLEDAEIGRSVLYDRNTLRETFDGADFFVYSTSHFRTRRMERRFSSGNDVWVEILDPPAFFSELTKGISDVASFSKEGPVAYRPRNFAPSDAAAGVDAAFLKSLEFEAEAEWRVLWEPRTQPVEPIIRTLPELTKYCRISAHPLVRASR